VLLVELLGVLHWTIVLQPELEVIRKKTRGHRSEQEQFQMVSYNERSCEERTQRYIEEHTYEKTVLVVIAKRPPVLRGGLLTTNVTVLGKAFHRHKKSAGHPIGQCQGERWNLVRNEGEPPEQKPDGVVERLGEYIKVRELFCPYGTYIVDNAHKPESKGGDGKGGVKEGSDAQPHSSKEEQF
jgi:hypothetical protein